MKPILILALVILSAGLYAQSSSTSSDELYRGEMLAGQGKLEEALDAFEATIAQYDSSFVPKLRVLDTIAGLMYRTALSDSLEESYRWTERYIDTARYYFGNGFDSREELMTMIRIPLKYIHASTARPIQEINLQLRTAWNVPETAVEYLLLFLSIDDDRLTPAERAHIEEVLQELNEPAPVYEALLSHPVSAPVYSHHIDILADIYQRLEEPELLVEMEYFLTLHNRAALAPALLFILLDRGETVEHPGFLASCLDILFLLQRFELILRHVDVFDSLQDNQSILHLMLAADRIGELSRAAGYAQRLLESESLDEETRHFVHLWLAFYNYQRDEDGQAIEWLDSRVDWTVRHFFFTALLLQESRDEDESNPVDVTSMFRRMDLRLPDQSLHIDPDIVERLAGMIIQLSEKGVSNAECRYLEALITFYSDNRDETRENLDAIPADSLKPGHTGMLEAIAMMRLGMEQPEKAREILERRAIPEPSSDLFIGRWMIQRDDARGVEYLEKAIDNNPLPDPDIFSLLGAWYAEHDRQEEAIDAMRKGVELFPRHPDLLNNLGYYLLVHTDLEDEAARMIDLAYEMLPDAAHIVDSKGWLLHQQGDCESALQILSPLVNRPVQSSELAAHIGAVYLCLDQPNRAKAYLELAISLDNDDFWVQQAQEYLNMVKEDSTEER